MVSFSCENCGDVLTKKKLDPHRNRCRGATFSCLDCMVTFKGFDYRSHTSCISEAQKYEKGLYKGKKGKNNRQNQPPTPSSAESQALVPLNAIPEPPKPDDRVAIVDAPPAAPSPPPMPNVFDFLVTDGAEPRGSLGPESEDGDWDDDGSDGSDESDGSDGSYGSDGSDGLDDMHPEPSYPDPPPYSEQDQYANVFQYQVPASEYSAEPFKAFERMPGGYPTQAQAFTTPATNKGHSRNISMDSNTGAKKRKRGQPEDLDLSRARAYPPNGDIIMTDVPPALHSGLTGGINRMMTRPEFPPSPDYSGGDGGEPSPGSPLKRTKTAEKEKDKTKLKDKKTSKDKTKDKTKDKKEKKEKTKDKDKDKDKDKKKRLESEPKKGGYWVQTRPRAPRKQLAIEAGPGPSPTEIVDNSGALIVHPAKQPSINLRAELFMTFVTKGPETPRGSSINKVLKRYHRERGDRVSKVAEEKELWKVLRLRRNDRGEIVLFAG